LNGGFFEGIGPEWKYRRQIQGGWTPAGWPKVGAAARDLFGCGLLQMAELAAAAAKRSVPHVDGRGRL